MREINQIQQQNIVIQVMKRMLSCRRAGRSLISLIALGVIAFGLSGCGHDNPLKKASTATLQKGYYQLKTSDRDCIDGIAARSPKSGYKESSVLHQECQARYPVIAKTFTKALGQTVSVADLQVPDFWLDFFKREHARQLTLTE